MISRQHEQLHNLRLEITLHLSRPDAGLVDQDMGKLGDKGPLAGNFRQQIGKLRRVRPSRLALIKGERQNGRQPFLFGMPLEAFIPNPPLVLEEAETHPLIRHRLMFKEQVKHNRRLAGPMQNAVQQIGLTFLQRLIDKACFDQRQCLPV